MCVQPGTNPAALQRYLAAFPDGATWLQRFNVNDFAPRALEL
jgi:hypothetical protein